MTIFYVNLYLGNKCYGGSEEGGWWYHTGEAIRSYPCYTVRRADRIAAIVERIAKHRNQVEKRRPPSSVLCKGYYEVLIEAHPAVDYPAQRPHYE